MYIILPVHLLSWFIYYVMMSNKVFIPRYIKTMLYLLMCRVWQALGAHVSFLLPTRLLVQSTSAVSQNGKTDFSVLLSFLSVNKGVSP